MVSITVSTPGKPAIKLDFAAKHPNNVTVKDVKAAIQAKFPRLIFNRQRLTLPVDGAKPTPLTDESKTLSSYGISEGAKLRLKDLGRQTGYRMLYLWEYAGPIVLNPLFFRYAHLLWGNFEPSALQITFRNLTIFHFVKRFLESAFVHRFSRDTLAVSYVARNCLYYWGVCGLLQGLTVYRPAYSASALKGSILNSSTWIYGWTGFIVAMELLNLQTHLHLRSLRRAPGQPRKYPTGFGFGTAVCANYWFETLQVLGLIGLTAGDLGTTVYLSIAVYFMQRWAGQKYARYKREFDPKVFPGKRYKMFPPIY